MVGEFMVKYRIITAPSWWDAEVSKYAVQVKIPCIPMWFRVTRYFAHRVQAESYITLILEEKGND